MGRVATKCSIGLADTQNVNTVTRMNSQPTRKPPLPPDLPVPAPAGAGGTPASTPATPGGPLTPEHLQALTLADQRGKKLRSAAGVALFNGKCIGTFSALSLLFVVAEAMFGEFDWVGVIMGIGLGVISWNEFRGRKLLQQFNPRAPAVLGWNQLALLGLIVAYAAWMMGVGLLGANPYEEAMRGEPMMIRMLGDIGSLYKTLTLTVYGALIVGTLIFQGLNSLYYFTRARILRGYLAETPAWVVQLQRCQAARR